MRSKIGLGPNAVRSVEHMAFCEVAVGARRVWAPACDVYHTDEAVVVRMELAGVAPDEVCIQATDSTLVVSGCRRDEEPRRKLRIEAMEIPFGAFERAVPLSVPVVPEQGRATYRHGMLEIVLPRAARTETRTIALEIRL